MPILTHEMLEAAVQQAEEQHRRGDSRGALVQYLEILKDRLASRVEIQAADLVVIERLADLSILFGEIQAADLQLQSLVGLLELAGNQYGADYARLKRAQLLIGSNDLRASYQILLDMSASIRDIRKIEFSPSGLDDWERQCHWRDTDEKGRLVLFSRIYLLMGSILAGLGQYRDAIAALRRGLSLIRSDSPDLVQQAKVHLSLALASALMEKGDIREADNLLIHMKDQINEIRQPGSKIRWHEIRAKLNLLCGNFGPALAEFDGIRSECRSRSLMHAEVKTALNLAQVLILVNQVQEAIGQLDGIADMPTLRQDPIYRARLHMLYGLASARGRSLADAVAIAPTVSEMWGMTASNAGDFADQGVMKTGNINALPQAVNYLTFFEDRALTFHWSLGQLDFQGANLALGHLQNVFENTDSEIIHTRLRLFEGMLSYYHGDLKESVAILSGVKSKLSQLKLLPELWQTGRFLGWSAKKLGQPEAEQSTIITETEHSLASMLSSLPSEKQAIFLLNKWTADEEYIAQEISQLVQMKNKWKKLPWFARPFARWGWMKRLYRLMQHIDQYKGSIARDYLHGRKTARINPPVPLWWYLLAHPPQQATISFLVLPDRVLLVNAQWLSLDFSISPVTRIQIREQISQWHDLISRAYLPRIGGEPAADMVSRAHEHAVELANALQLSNLLGNFSPHVRALTFIPDDSLHGFPFAALPYKNGVLIDRFALSIGFEQLPSGEVTARRQRRFAVVALSEGFGAYPALPGTLEEIDVVKKWAAQRNISVDQLTNFDAKKTAVLENLHRSVIAHIATHGIFEPGQPDRSGLLMAASEGNPAVLSLRELSQLNLSGMKHITLSSCWAADHFMLPGRWVISLPETLYRAGAQSILGCLWPVDDSLVIEFSKRFYYYVDRMSRSEALRQTQLDFVHGRVQGYSLQETGRIDQWSGFTLYGDHRKLDL